MKTTQENNKVTRIAINGEVTEEAVYGGRFSAEYTLYLYWCQYIAKCDYNNLCNFARFKDIRTIAKHSAFIEDGMDVISCVATMEHERNPLIGKVHGKYEYQPKYLNS